MSQYVLGRFVSTLGLLAGASIVVFLLLRLSPGDPVLLILSEGGASTGDAEVVAQLRRELGLDVSLPVQYGQWLAKVAQGDLGRSFVTGRPVAESIAQRLPATLLLTGVSLVLAVLVALPVGILCALRPGGWVDGLCRVVALIGVSLPGFWLGLLLVWAFSVRLGLLPAIGAGSWRHLILPSIALAVGVAATETRLIRASLLEVLGQPYTTVARAKGLAERVILVRHALRNALIPAVTSLGLSLGGLLGGAVVIESVFAYPGLGKLTLDAISSRDYPLIQAFVLMMTLIFVACSLLVDVAYAVIDPRVRLGARTR